MQLDPSLYAHHLDGFDMTDEEKLRFMTDMWTIMSSFIDRAFGETTEQILLGTNARAGIDPRADEIDSMDNLISEFERAAGKDAARKSSP